jgi:hypothetical protein
LEIPDRDRSALGGDPAGKAFADGDPEAGLDLFLEAPRGTGRKLIRFVIQQQDRRGVHVEDRDDPDKQRLQQPTQVEVRKSRLRDALEAGGKA